VEGDEGIDVRVVLVSWPRQKQVTDSGKDERDDEVDVVVGIQKLARCRRWKEVVSVESEEGEQILRSFLKLAETEGVRFEVRKVKGGIVQVNAGEEAMFLQNGYDGVTRHYSVINGGTFDHLHIGHKLLLSMTAFMLDRYDEDSPSAGSRLITIGITAADQLKNKKYAEFLQSWTERQQAVHSFLRGIMCFDPPGKENEEIEERNNPEPNGHVVEVKLTDGLAIRYTEIWDPFGPTITDPNVTALVLSEETRKGGQAVNERRKEIGFQLLEVFEVDVLDAEDEFDSSQDDSIEKQFLKKLSSTQLRKARHERDEGKSKV
jgi:phosphopantetheine adenylyltransferase